MKSLNKMLTKEEQMELSAEMGTEYVFHYDSRVNKGLPCYIREAMEREGVVRLSNGRFVKKSSLVA